MWMQGTKAEARFSKCGVGNGIQVANTDESSTLGYEQTNAEGPFGRLSVPSPFSDEALLAKQTLVD